MCLSAHAYAQASQQASASATTATSAQGSSAPAQTSKTSDKKEPVVAQSSVVQVDAEALDSNKKLMVEAAIEYSQKIAEDQVGGREAGTDYTLGLGYRVNDLAAIKAKGILNKQDSGQKETTFSNTQIGLSIKGKKINEQLETVHALTGTLPTNKDSQQVDRLKGAIALANGLKYNGVHVIATYLLGIAKNIHEYTVNADGTPNVEYTLTNSVELVFPLNDQFAISTSGLFKNGRTYGGYQRSAFAFSADLNYEIIKNFAVNLGTSNEGAAVKANGSDSNISAYDDKSSVYRLGLSYVY